MRFPMSFRSWAQQARRAEDVRGVFLAVEIGGEAGAIGGRAGENDDQIGRREGILRDQVTRHAGKPPWGGEPCAAGQEEEREEAPDQKFEETAHPSPRLSTAVGKPVENKK